MRDVKFEIMFLVHTKDFESEIKKHYTTLDRLTDGRDCFDYNSVQIIAKGQFTGLTDKNGADIYEGDIISFSNGTLSQDVNGDIPCPNGSPMRYSKNENLIREVIYEKSSFRINNGNPLGSAYLSSDEIEIIGNIHQNSDLLK